MQNKFQREYLVRLPLPLAQLYGRAYNTKDGRGRHDNSFYLFEALIKLAACPLIAAYRDEVLRCSPRNEALDRLLVQLALPSLGQWVGFLRELARHFDQFPDKSSHPMGHVWQQLNHKRSDLPGVLALYQRVKNGPEGKPAGDKSCSLLQLFDSLVQYRNTVFGHGAGRAASFYEEEMGPLLFPAVNDILAEGTLELLGPRGSKLVYLAEVKTLDETRVELGMRELVGLQSERIAGLEVEEDQAANLVPHRVAVQWPGRKVPVPLDPLLVYRETELSEDVLFLNRDRNGRQVEYLSYATGQTERDKSMAPTMARLLTKITGKEVSPERLDQLKEQSLADTLSVEAITEPAESATRVLGDYEILTELGRGGMGVVYLARQLSLGRLVALKMLPADLAGDDVALARFHREMRALGRCEHANIVKVLSTGTMSDGQLYYAMEYVPGADLEQVWRELAGPNRQGDAKTLGSTTWSSAVITASGKLREKCFERTRAGGKQKTVVDKQSNHATTPSGASESMSIADLPLPPLPEIPSHYEEPGGYTRRVSILIRDTARALQAVHDQNIVHRDIKPANLMLTPDCSRVVLMDFGLAKGDAMSLTASRSAGFLGTLRYSAPEQLASAQLKVGPRADVRGLGVTMWELLTRDRLFGDAEDERQLTSWVLTRDVPRLRDVDATLDPDLEAIVTRATERSEESRIQTAGQMADYLDLYLEGKPIPIRTPSAPELLRRWIGQHKAIVGLAMSSCLFIMIVVLVAFVSVSRSRNNAIAARDEAIEARTAAVEARRDADERRKQEEVARKAAEEARIAFSRVLSKLSEFSKEFESELTSKGAEPPRSQSAVRSRVNLKTRKLTPVEIEEKYSHIDKLTRKLEGTSSSAQRQQIIEELIELWGKTYKELARAPTMFGD